MENLYQEAERMLEESEPLKEKRLRYMLNEQYQFFIEAQENVRTTIRDLKSRCGTVPETERRYILKRFKEFIKKRVGEAEEMIHHVNSLKVN